MDDEDEEWQHPLARRVQSKVSRSAQPNHSTQGQASAVGAHHHRHLGAESSRLSHEHHERSPYIPHEVALKERLQRLGPPKFSRKRGPDVAKSWF